MKRCSVVYALPHRQWVWEVSLVDEATVGDALRLAREQALVQQVPWDGPVGIFGALCDRNAVPRDGDRIEIYRPLKADPKASRRERAKAPREVPDPAARRPRKRSPP